MSHLAARNTPMSGDGNSDYRWTLALSFAAMLVPSAAATGAVAAAIGAGALQASLAYVRSPVTARFRRLADQWISDSENFSSVDDMILHPAYQEITGMGPAVISLLIEELDREPNHWFAALHAVTGQNPVAPEDAGDVDKMVEAWLEWAEARGYR